MWHRGHSAASNLGPATSATDTQPAVRPTIFMLRYRDTKLIIYIVHCNPDRTLAEAMRFNLSLFLWRSAVRAPEVFAMLKVRHCEHQHCSAMSDPAAGGCCMQWSCSLVTQHMTDTWHRPGGYQGQDTGPVSVFSPWCGGSPAPPHSVFRIDEAVAWSRWLLCKIIPVSPQVSPVWGGISLGNNDFPVARGLPSSPRSCDRLIAFSVRVIIWHMTHGIADRL